MITPVMLCPHHIVIQIFKKPKCGGGVTRKKKKRIYKRNKTKNYFIFFLIFVYLNSPTERSSLAQKLIK